MDNFSQLTSRNIKNAIGFINKYLNKNIIYGQYKKIEHLPKENNRIETKIINEDNIIGIDSKQKITKKRKAGIDLIRIVTMIGIVYTHVLHQGKGIYKYNKYKKQLKNTDTYIFWHVNTYALISGIIGNKSTKYSNLLYIWLCVVFYSVIIHYYYLKYKHDEDVKDDLFIEYYPIIYKRYWYCTSYFGMFIFLPVVNKGIQQLNKTEFKLLIMSIFGIFIFWQNYINVNGDAFKINGGHSTIWLLCLYIIGAYIGKYNLVYTGIKRYIFSLIYLFMFFFICMIYNKYSNYIISDLIENYKIKIINFIKRLMSKKLNSIITTTQAILITLFFLQLKYNEYLSKLITFIGPLTFGVYLIHFNKIARKKYLSHLLNGESYNLTFNEVIKILILKSLKIFLECIIIEYLRHLLFIILKIRKICMSIENIIYKYCSLI